MAYDTVGIVGAGAVVNDLHLPVLLNMTSLRVAWVADADNERSRSVARAFGVEHVDLPPDLKDFPPCDVVLLAVPVFARREYYLALAKRGTAVFAEKPLSMKAVEHRELVELYESGQLGCGFIRRFYDSTRVVLSALESGIFGPPRGIRVRESSLVMKTGRASTYLDRPSSEGGGFTLDVGCHGIDLALFLVKARRFDVLSKEVVWDDGTDRQVAFRLSLETADGNRPVFDYRGGWLGPSEHGVEVTFEKARLRFGITPGAVVSLSGVDAESHQLFLQREPQGARTINQAAFLEWQSFLDGMREGRATDVDASSCIVTTEVLEEILSEETVS